MNFFNNLKMRTKLIITFLLVSIIPIAIVAVESGKTASEALMHHAFEHLSSVRKIKKHQIEHLFKRFQSELEVLADTVHFFMDDAYDILKQSNAINVSEEDFLSHIEVKGEDYFENFIKRRGYCDLFLIRPDGYCFYTVDKEADYRTNLVNGKWSSSNLGQLIRKVINTRQFGFADFAPYAPSNNEPAAFIAMPIVHDGKLEMIVALQISLDRVNRIMEQRDGMGKTGETYLVGPDKRMRSDSYLDPQGHSVKASFAGTIEKNGVDTEAAREALAGKTGEKVIIDYNGNQVLSAFTPVNVLGTTWALLSEIDCSEVKEPINTLIHKIMFISGIVILFVIGAAIFISMLIARPLQKATIFAQAVAAGDMDASLDVDQKDETGQVCAALKSIAETLKKMVSEVKTTANEIRHGRLRYRSSAKGFSGEFAGMLEDINSLADVFVNDIDNLPQPVMAIDKDFNVLYLNETGKKLAGSDAEGRKCYEVFKTSDCQTERCACARAMRSLQKVTSETDAHPGGLDLEIEYFGLPICDENGNAVGAFELVVDQTEIKNMLNRMKRVAAEANEISERVSSASEELSAQVEQVSQGAEEQKARMGETATAMEEMNATVLEVAKNASNAAESAGTAKEEAENGEQIVERAIAAINRVSELAQGLKENMHALGSKAESIGQVMNVISDIADQTNLLALNAAIEAARAGEAGRGFAVVADEVRKLAEKTMGATREVGEAISSIQTAAKQNIESMDVASKAVEEATELAGESGEALKKIVDLSIENSNQIQSIATASEEQSATSEEISRSVEEVNRIVGETAEAMIQSSQAVQELARMASELREVIKELEG
ncbi:methyl-accepting chemotaxis protein [Desulfovulcanus sp.]